MTFSSAIIVLKKSYCKILNYENTIKLLFAPVLSVVAAGLQLEIKFKFKKYNRKFTRLEGRKIKFCKYQLYEGTLIYIM